MKSLVVVTVVLLAAMTAACSSSPEPQKIACNIETPNLKFFDGRTGKAVVFYHKVDASDQIVCFNGPGYDPWTQDKLYEVTQAIRAEILKQPAPSKPKPCLTPAPTPCPNLEDKPSLPDADSQPLRASVE